MDAHQLNFRPFSRTVLHPMKMNVGPQSFNFIITYPVNKRLRVIQLVLLGADGFKIPIPLHVCGKS